MFWKSSTCRIVFKYESDAQVARRYAVQKRSLFGDVRVLYVVQVLQVPFPVFSESSIQSRDESFNKVPQRTSTSSGYSTESLSSVLWGQQFPRIHRKSCLKKQWNEAVMSRSRVNLCRVRTEVTGKSSRQLIVSCTRLVIIQVISHHLPLQLILMAMKRTPRRLNCLCLPGCKLSHWISNMHENHELGFPICSSLRKGTATCIPPARLYIYRYYLNLGQC